MRNYTAGEPPARPRTQARGVSLADVSMHEPREYGHLRLMSDAGRSAGAADPPVPPPAADARFEAFYALAGPLLDVQGRAREVYLGRSPATFDGLSALLDELLPEEDGLAARVARAVRLSPQQLAQLRAGVVDPLVLPVASVVRLGGAAALSLPQLEALTLRDHHALAGGVAGPTPPGAGAGWEQTALASLRAMWEQLYGGPPPP